MKRLIVFFVFLSILLASFDSFAATKKDGDWEYDTTGYGDSKTVRITGYAPSGDIPEVLEVPEMLGGCPVKEIGRLRNVVTIQSSPNNTPTAPPRKAATMASKEETP